MNQSAFEQGSSISLSKSFSFFELALSTCLFIYFLTTALAVFKAYKTGRTKSNEFVFLVGRSFLCVLLIATLLGVWK
ncbi:hypothetical protein [Pseudoalteromonas luteoviolacea]|uniref:Uncharacterized protein n=1 Tax=Pseudoalteromonas luteoviolacea S4060-1 TaxID=1365257 RepID=A0A167KW23_9GAMM|nr:hypothetical protein [Pseudoalteromonas luteoviolacea]KZN63378.1 hypothetical protein N478_03755 [Pseudoalteromonas luteoviolacea S4060-1]